MTVHEKLFMYRVKKLKMSQRRVAQMLHVSQATLSNYESGKRQLTLDILVHIRKTYNMSPDEFKDLFDDI
ncbi:helix-turn-helix domain-containing protein [Mangrovibacillus cuniculi]|uniref:Helix-turn-helix transcriptional regulator n=1 Tax=Mangrovibacillus cuniculi TaxID=2593652 RepID=A0A7S8CCW6_9BACI|nr:helix-turn-helix transcriptional regulator [Mangrovibacillus cuniculi]QPC47670.1 helix-turn-helix transcriptional regulator [Mangrovibacillus cuniculi]